MTLYHFPKGKHSRKLTPGPFTKYQHYKPYLQYEFSRICVYCRQPDSSAPAVVYGVDHYRPKGKPEFAALACDYLNLFYCCNKCNSRKGSYWPTNEALGPYVVNPCDHDMHTELRFDSKTGEVEARSFNGQHTVELLQLNTGALVEYRLLTLRTLSSLEKEMAELKGELVGIAKALKNGDITDEDADEELVAISKDMSLLEAAIHMHTGEGPLAPP